MVAGDPPAPWGLRIIIPAAGVWSGGWDRDEHVVLISGEGYSISDADTGERLVRDRDGVRTSAALSDRYLSFTIPATGEKIAVFGIHGGDGGHHGHDGWSLEAIYPWWPNTNIILEPNLGPGAGRREYLDGTYLIDVKRLSGWLKCGFSPSGCRFMILGSGGAEVFSY